MLICIGQSRQGINRFSNQGLFPEALNSPRLPEVIVNGQMSAIVGLAKIVQVLRVEPINHYDVEGFDVEVSDATIVGR